MITTIIVHQFEPFHTPTLGNKRLFGGGIVDQQDVTVTIPGVVNGLSGTHCNNPGPLCLKMPENQEGLRLAGRNCGLKSWIAG